jgi:hypothetical protein
MELLHRGGVFRSCSSPSDGTRAPGGCSTPSEASSGIGRRLRASRAIVVASLPEIRDFTIEGVLPRDQRRTACNGQSSLPRDQRRTAVIAHEMQKARRQPRDP